VKYKTINMHEKTHSELRFISNCLDRKMTSVLAEMIAEIFDLFQIYKPEGSARIFFDSHSGTLVVTTSGKSRYANSVASVQHNATEQEENEAIKSELEEKLSKTFETGE